MWTDALIPNRSKGITTVMSDQETCLLDCDSIGVEMESPTSSADSARYSPYNRAAYRAMNSGTNLKNFYIGAYMLY